MHVIAIKADGGQEIGLGHLSRCVALAQELEAQGCRVIFISNGSHEILTRNGFEVIDIGLYVTNASDIATVAELEILEKLLLDKHVDCMIIDRYGLSKEYFITSKHIVPVVIYIDDLNSYTYPVDMVINGNCYAVDINYSGYDNNTRFLLGSPYLLLRKEFREAAPNVISNRVSRIMITTGGSNPKNTMERILHDLVRINLLKDIEIKVIVGSSFIHSDKLNEIAQSNDNVELIYNANMIEVMKSTDIAISASGSTLYELARLGIPNISFIIGEDQLMLAKKMNSLGCTLNVGWYGVETNNEIIDKLKELIGNYELRKIVNQRCKKLIDGMGTSRCANEIIEMLNDKFYKK